MEVLHNLTINLDSQDGVDDRPLYDKLRARGEWTLDELVAIALEQISLLEIKLAQHELRIR